MAQETLSVREAAERVGVSPATLRRWAEAGAIPELAGGQEWTSAAVSHARVVARLRGRGHRLEEIRVAGERGTPAHAYIGVSRSWCVCRATARHT